MQFKNARQRKAVMANIRFYNTRRNLPIKYQKKLSSRDEVDPVAKQELQLYIENDGELYRQQNVPIEQNLEKKMKKGTYDPDKATLLYYHLADNGAKKYSREFGGQFTKADKLAVAKSMRRGFEKEHI